MFLAEVIGSIWSTKKYDTLTGYKMLIIQPVNASGDYIDEPLVAIDTIGAGAGELVFYITLGEAVIPLHLQKAPCDTSIVGIVDSLFSADVKEGIK